MSMPAHLGFASLSCEHKHLTALDSSTHPLVTLTASKWLSCHHNGYHDFQFFLHAYKYQHSTKPPPCPSRLKQATNNTLILKHPLATLKTEFPRKASISEPSYHAQIMLYDCQYKLFQPCFQTRHAQGSKWDQLES